MVTVENLQFFSVLDMLDFKFVGSWYNIHNIQYFIEKT